MFQREVLSLRSGLPVLMTTGYFREEDQNLACAAGVRELVLKPFTVDELAQILERLFPQEKQTSAAMGRDLGHT